MTQSWLVLPAHQILFTLIMIEKAVNKKAAAANQPMKGNKGKTKRCPTSKLLCHSLFPLIGLGICRLHKLHGHDSPVSQYDRPL
eukprot:1159545-Pelagomonas_calceolata.AAC.2